MKTGWKLIVWIDDEKQEMCCISKRAASVQLSAYVLFLAETRRSFKQFHFSMKKSGGMK